MVQVAGLVALSLFLSFVLPSGFCSFLLPPYAHQLLGLGWMVSASPPVRLFFVICFLSLFLALLRADPGVGEIWGQLLEGLGSAFVLFLFCANVSGMRPRSL